MAFPFIREIMQANELNRRISNVGLFASENLIDELNDEHATQQGRMKLSMELREYCLSISNFSKPVNNLLTGLAEFERNCEFHRNLQSNFLFPKIINAKY